jgi:hypothetical protein
MLKIKLINEQCTLNNFHFVDVKLYTPNLPFKIKIQILDSETLQRLIPGTSAKLNAILQVRDGTQITIPGTMIFNPDDRSMWQIAITAVQSNDIVGSNVQFNLDFTGDSTTSDLADASDLRSGMAYSILSKIQFDGEC